MFTLLNKAFGVRVTVIYKSGAKAHARFSHFHATQNGGVVTRAEWRRPWLSWSREPLWLNVDAIEAIWQGRH